MNVAFTALARREVELQVGVRSRNLGHVLQHRVAQRSTSEIRMQDHARRIDDRLQRIGQ